MTATEQPGPARLLSVREVAEMLSMSPGWVRDHAAGRRLPVIPCVRFGSAIRFRESTLLEWVSRMERLAG